MARRHQPKKGGAVQGAAQRLFDAGVHPAQALLEAVECHGCNDLGYRVVGGIKKECPHCGTAAQYANEIDGAEWVGDL